MTKIGSLPFFGFPPAGSGVSPKSRIVRYFFRRSGMCLRFVACHPERSEGPVWSGGAIIEPHDPQIPRYARDDSHDAFLFFEAVRLAGVSSFVEARFAGARPAPSRLRRKASMMSMTSPALSSSRS